MTDSAETMRALVQWLKDAPTSVYTFTTDGQATVCHPRYLLALDRDVIIALLEREIAALSASGTKSDGGVESRHAHYRDGTQKPISPDDYDSAGLCEAGVAPGPSDPIPSQPDEVEAIALQFFDGQSVPEVAKGDYETFIVVTERDDGSRYSFCAYYLNQYPLQYDECQGRCSTGSDCEDGCPTTGWFYDESNFEYEHCYHPVTGKVIRWAAIPTAAAILAMQAERRGEIELAYGLLWVIGSDRSTTHGNALYHARKALLGMLDRAGQSRGISAARKLLDDDSATPGFFRNAPDPLDPATAQPTPIAGVEPVAWQSRQRFNLERMAMGNIGGWSQCSSDEAMDHWARRPDFEYRGLFTRSQLEAHAAEQVRPLVEALEGLIEAVRRDSDEGGKGISGYTGARLTDAKNAIRARGQV